MQNRYGGVAAPKTTHENPMQRLPPHVAQYYNGMAPVVSLSSIVQSQGRILNGFAKQPKCHCIAPPCACDAGDLVARPDLTPIGEAMRRAGGYSADRAAQKQADVRDPSRKWSLAGIAVALGLVVFVFSKGAK